jgi:hypothetical protein
MSTTLKLSVVFAGLSYLLCLLTPFGVAAVIVSHGFSAFVLWSEKYAADQLKDLKAKQQSLEERINIIQIQRNIGR